MGRVSVDLAGSGTIEGLDEGAVELAVAAEPAPTWAHPSSGAAAPAR